MRGQDSIVVFFFGAADAGETSWGRGAAPGPYRSSPSLSHLSMSLHDENAHTPQTRTLC